MLQLCVRVSVEEHFVGGHVEGWYDLLGVADELPIQVSVKVTQVISIDVQKRLSNQIDL